MGTVGCPQPSVCCKGNIATCLACAADVSPAEYCSEFPKTVGCKPATKCEATTKKAKCADVAGCAWVGKTFAKGGRCQEEEEEEEEGGSSDDNKCATIKKRTSCKSTSACLWDGPTFAKGGRCSSAATSTT